MTPDLPLRTGGTRPPPGAPLTLGPPCASARHPVEPRQQRLAPAPRGVQCRANIRNPSPHPTTPTAHAAIRAPTGTGKPQDDRTPSPALRHSDKAMAEPTAPPKTRPQSATLDAAHEVIRALGLRSSDRDPPPPEDADTDSDLEMVSQAPAGSAPAGPPPPAGSVQSLFSRGSWATAPGKVGAPGTILGPPPKTRHWPQWFTEPHAPPCATV